MSPALLKLTGSVESYFSTGMQHSKAAAGFGSALVDVAKSVENDKDISDPIMKVMSLMICQVVLPFNSLIKCVILLTVNRTILTMLVHRILYWIN